MKKIFSLLMLTALLMTVGCNKLLDLKPKDFISPENYFNSEAGLNAALTGVYDILGKEEVYGNNIPVLYSIADEGYYSRSAYVEGPAIYVFDASDPTVDFLWKFLYQGIERANMLLENAGKVEMDATAKNVILGETKFLRAYYYYLLVDFWGDVPLKTTSTTSVSAVDIARTPSKEVYEFILKEMEEAEGMVKTATELGFGGRVSKTTVQGILARVCLKMAGEPLKDVSKYNDALKWAKKVVTPDDGAPEHALNNSFSNIFYRHSADLYDIQESMWEVEFYGNRSGDFEGGRIGNTLGLQCNDEVYGYGYGFINATFKLFDSYDDTDTRRDWTIAPYKYQYTTVSGVSTVSDSLFYTATQIYDRNAGKWRRKDERLLPRHKNYTPTNFPLLRYADVLLMLAEAENEVNGPTDIAKSAIKEVRDRANAPDVIATISSKEEMRTFIKEERFRELAFEALRKHDLIRWGDFVGTMNAIGTELSTATGAGANFIYGGAAGKNVRERHKLLPIPISELSLNRAMVQNPSW